MMSTAVATGRRREAPRFAPVAHEALPTRAKPSPQLRMAHNPDDPRCERIRALRTELLLRRREVERAEFVVLLSPCSGEGRSQLAAELAIAFSQLGRTLLVDADMRHPIQHALFGADNRDGLSRAIAGNRTPCLHAVEGLPELFLLTAGPAPINPLELVLNNFFAWLIEAWRRDYEFVVMDTAPVQHYSDGLAIANLAGSVLALSRAQHTPYRETRDMLRRLATTQAQVLGAVISHF